MIVNCISKLLSGFLRVIFLMSVKGRENVPKEGGFFLCSNHSSYWDPVVLGATSPRRTGFMAKEELFKNPVFGRLIKALGAYPIKRGGHGDIAAVRCAMEIVRSGKVTVIFPEGRRVRSREERSKIKNGIVKLAIQTKSPIQPVGINSKYRLFGRLKVVYGKPIYYDEYYGKKPSDEELDKLAQDLMDTIYELGEMK
jgi:1-acyl-sn-glycerol-3-phosphate acyltransferase